MKIQGANNMFKYLKPLAVIGLSALFIAGCGSTDVNNSADSAAKPAAAPENNEQEQEKVDQEQTDKTNEEGIIRILEQNLQYNVNGEQKEQTAFLKYNDNQNYSMYVLPEYELTAEEPNKDVIFWSEDDSIFMRIELLPADVDWALMEENTQAQLAAVNAEVIQADVPEDPFFTNSWAMETKSGEEVVTSYLIKNEKQPLKLTLFTKENADHKDPFIEMSKTILKEPK